MCIDFILKKEMQMWLREMNGNIDENKEDLNKQIYHQVLESEESIVGG